MTKMLDLINFEPVSDATPHEALECFMAWMYRADRSLHNEIFLRTSDTVVMDRVMQTFSCKVISMVTVHGTKLMRIDCARVVMAFVCARVRHGSGECFNYEVLGLRWADNSLLTDKVRRALSLGEGDLKTARLDDVVDDFLGSPGRV